MVRMPMAEAVLRETVLGDLTDPSSSKQSTHLAPRPEFYAVEAKDRLLRDLDWNLRCRSVHFRDATRYG